MFKAFKRCYRFPTSLLVVLHKHNNGERENCNPNRSFNREYQLDALCDLPIIYPLALTNG